MLNVNGVLDPSALTFHKSGSECAVFRYAGYRSLAAGSGQYVAGVCYVAAILKVPLNDRPD